VIPAPFERSAADLSQRVVRALDFADEVVDDLVHAAIGGRADDRGVSAFEAGHASGDLAAKVAAETAMLLHAVAPLRPRDAGLAARIDRLAQALAPLVRGADVQAALCMDPAHALDHAMGHLLLEDLGCADAGFDALLRMAMRDGRAIGSERAPYRVLQQAWLERLWPAGMPSRREETGALAGSSLGRPLDVPHLDRDDAYAFTHAVLFATAMGRRRPALPRRRADIEADALSALGFALETNDLDLVAEVLWTWPMLALRWHAAAAFALGHLAAVQDELGFLPGRRFERDRVAGGPSIEATRHVRATAYHATYVLGFLCAATLLRGPGRAPPGGHATPGAGAALLAALDPGDPLNAWCDSLRRADGARQDAVAPLLLDVLMRRAAAAGDLGAIERQLALAAAGGLPSGAATVQAGALLTRARCLAKAMTPAAAGASSPA